jgi:hypothetical protein
LSIHTGSSGVSAGDISIVVGESAVSGKTGIFHSSLARASNVGGSVRSPA